MSEPHSALNVSIATALKAWEQWLGRASKLFDSLSEEEMFTEIAPGRNRAVYIFGHLIAVDDSMMPQLRLGEPSYVHLRQLFIEKPDRAVELPPVSELREAWRKVNGTLSERFSSLAPEEWLERHGTVSEEDFAKEPHRNRLALLLSRTSHLSYHFGQLVIRSKP